MNFPRGGGWYNKNKATDQTEEARNKTKWKSTNQSRLLPMITSHYQPK